MSTYDWIVIGGGITGAALGYELAKRGLKVLLLEKAAQPKNATRYSYGGLAYWSGTDALTSQLCQEGIELHRHLSAELDADTEFRELDLLLTIDAEANSQEISDRYNKFAISPQLLDVQEACSLEPLLNPEAISGALLLPHGHINAQKTADAYLRALRRAGGIIKYEEAIELLRQGNQIKGVKTPNQTYHCANTVVCAGGLSRSLLQEAGIEVEVYFTHDGVILTPPVDIKLRTLVMPAVLQRFELEAEATKSQLERLWDQPGYEPVASVIDPGAIQFLDGSFCLGQESRILSDPTASVDLAASETKIRTEIARILPSLANIPGTLHHCLVSFAKNSRPSVGKIDHFQGVYLFNGFTSTLVFAPPLARHFANWAIAEEDEILSQLSPVVTPD